MKLYRLILIVLFILLSALSTYLPGVVANDSRVFVFALICVELLKEFAWYELKKSCKNSKDWVCKLFKKKDKIIEKKVESVDP